MIRWIPLALGALLGVAVLVTAEVRYAARPMLPADAPADVIVAARVLTSRLNTGAALARTRAELAPDCALPPGLSGTVEVERAWRPWGSWRYLACLGPRYPGAVLVHEVARHVVPQEAGQGWDREHLRTDLAEVEAGLLEVLDR